MGVPLNLIHLLNRAITSFFLLAILNPVSVLKILNPLNGPGFTLTHRLLLTLPYLSLLTLPYQALLYPDPALTE